MAKCEQTGAMIRLDEGNFVGDPFTGEWRFAADSAPLGPGELNLPVRDLLKSPASFIDWMAHMGEKTWFQPKKFFEFMDRLRDDNDLHRSL